MLSAPDTEGAVGGIISYYAREIRGITKNPRRSRRVAIQYRIATNPLFRLNTSFLPSSDYRTQCDNVAAVCYFKRAMFDYPKRIYCFGC